MRKRARVVAVVVACVLGLGTGVYFWARAVYVLPDASCGVVSGGVVAPARLASGPPRAPRCFLAAARRCATAGIRVHTQGTEQATDYVFIVGGGGPPGKCRVTEYSQDRSYLGIGLVRVTGCRETSATSRGVLLSCPMLPGPIQIPPSVAG